MGIKLPKYDQNGDVFRCDALFKKAGFSVSLSIAAFVAVDLLSLLVLIVLLMVALAVVF